MHAKERRMMIALNNLSARILLRTEGSFISSLYSHPPDDDLSEDVDDGRDHEEHESELNQACKIKAPGGFGKFIGNDTGQAIAGLKMLVGMKLELPMTMVTAIVSPKCPPQREENSCKYS